HLSNIRAGLPIFWDKPFHTDDWVTLGENYGKVAKITMRTTRLLTWNNTLVIIPNETIINQVLVNHSTNGSTRVDVPVTAAVNGDLSPKREAILEAVRAVDGVLKDPPPAVVIKAISPDGVELIVQAWIANAQQQRPISFQILEAAKPALDAHS